jgi:hypothetical protein
MKMRVVLRGFPFIESAFDCLDELDLAVIGFDFERRETYRSWCSKSAWVVDDDCLISVVLILTPLSLDAELDVADESGDTSIFLL